MYPEQKSNLHYLAVTRMSLICGLVFVNRWAKEGIILSLGQNL
jgi:hypothetical protein